MSEKKKTKQPKKSKPFTRANPVARTIRVGNIKEVNGNVTITGRDSYTRTIVNHITNIQGALTPGQVVETDLQLEIETLEHGVRGYLEDLKTEALNEGTSIPYKDLEHYTLSEAGEFFGREQSIRDLRETLKRSRLTILQAESGAGKTSLLQAGLIPRLMTEDQLPVWFRPQFVNPVLVIKKKFLGDLELSPKLAGAPLVDFLRRVQRITGRQTALYLILDQFEEFFSKHTNKVDQETFIRELAECLNDATLNVRWIISLTTEALGQLYKLDPYIQIPKLNVYTLNFLNRQEAADAIAQPAQRYGLTFEAGLLEQLLDDLGPHKDTQISPTQIQLVCTALYKDLQGKSTVFTVAQYEKKGRAVEILRSYVGNVLQHDLLDSERAPAYKILEELVTSEKRRTIRAKTDLITALASMGVSQALAESTLSHLVKSHLLRRLGSEEEEIKYEIVHDYLLNEIEIDEGTRGVKEAEELLEQGVKNWKNHQLLIPPDAIKLIERQRNNITINSEVAKLLFLSAVEYGQDSEKWVQLIFVEHRNELIAYYGQEKDARKSRDGLWSLRYTLPTAQRARVAVAKGSSILLNLSRQAGIFLLTAILFFIIGTFGVRATSQFKEWAAVEKYPDQCLGGSKPSNPITAIDAANGSHVVVYDSAKASLCESIDTGTYWSLLNSAHLKNLIVHSMAVNQKIYLLTDQSIVYQNDASNWNVVNFPLDIKSPFQDFAVADDRKMIYAVSEEHEISRYDTENQKWVEPLSLEKITGAITGLAVNYRFLVVSTTDGIWYRDLTKDSAWTQFQQGLKDEPTIIAIGTVRPVRTGARTFINLGDDDWFLAVTKTGSVYLGKLTVLDSLIPYGNIPIQDHEQIVSLTVKGYSRLATSTSGLFCEQSWTILNAEWWHYLFSSNKPCQ